MKNTVERFKQTMRIGAVVLSLLLQFLFMAVGAQAAPGDLDASFGTGGKVLTDFASSPFGYEKALSVAIQSDGKIVIAGFPFSNGGFALARYNANGTLDTTFGTGGKVTTDFASGFARAYSVAIQDSKIVIAGFTFNGTKDYFALARYNANGTLDTTFGTSGKVTTDFAIGSQAYSAAIQSDGKIVAAGGTFNLPNGDFALARYNADGTLDTSFGPNKDGKVTTDFASSYDVAFDVAIQSDGKIVAAGSAYGTYLDFALARYNADGTLDTSFGPNKDGKITTDFASSADDARSVAIQSDGRIVAAGIAFNGTNYDFALARYNADGTLDTSFGPNKDGKVTTDFASGYYRAFSVGIQSDGRIVVAGNAWNGTNFDFALARYNPDGNLDTTFGTSGKVTTDFASGNDEALSVAIQSDGKIVVVGSAWNGADFNFALARYLALTPSEQIVTIVNFFDTSVSEGTLTGVGSTTTSADGKLNALENMLKQAEALIQSGSIADACLQLMDAYKKTDGDPNPPDFVTGPAAAQLASQIQSLMTSLGCQ